MEIFGIGISLGFIVGALMSYNKNRSILWAFVHGFFGWFYVVYNILFK